MASEMSPDSPEQHREDGTHLGDTASPEAGVPAEPITGTGHLGAPAASAEPVEETAKVCQFFLKQKCHFGQRCRLRHSDPTLDDSGVPSSDHDDTSDEEKTDKHTKKKDKAKQPEYQQGQESNKKPRMRTAADVISRILWDQSVDSSQFVVGYLDRFLGVLERPFCDFNWKVNPCDCDYTSELALPRHRIQYFTYKGLRVWDRHTRTDRVFGSTGQSLAPPFGKEEEVKETNTDVQEQQDGLKTSEERPPAVSGKEGSDTGERADTQNTHLEEAEQNEMNIHVPDSTCRGSTSQESQGARVAEEAANRLSDSTDKMTPREQETVQVEAEEEAEWKEDWEGKEDALGCLAALNIKRAPLKQREEARGSRPPKKRPTHFITFRANTPAILSSFQQLQEELTSLLPSSAPHWQKASSLHVTLCLLMLHGPAQVAAAGEILRKFAHLDRNHLVTVTFPVKLKHFNGKVLYLSPQPQLPIQQLNSGLQETFRREGWLHRDSYNPRYHLTLAKVQDREGERIFEGVGDLRVGKNLNFGRLPINTLHLCKVDHCKADGFYETVCSVNLR